MNESNDDSAMFWATVQTAHAVAQAMSMKNQPTDDGVNSLCKALASSPWQLNAAFRIKPSWRTLIDRGFAYRKMKRLRKELSEEENSRAQRDKLEKLTRTLGLLEFGVGVNEEWFRRLDRMVANGEMTKEDLKKMLASIEVMWNEEGELVVQKFHLFSRSVISIFFLCWISLSLIFLLASIEQFERFGLSGNGGWFFFCYFVWSIWPTWCVWRLGPRSWMSTRKLSRLFPFLIQIRRLPSYRHD